jgi:ABC-type dipeptide/oligopeptide/nickel transport system ATPase component
MLEKFQTWGRPRSAPPTDAGGVVLEVRGLRTALYNRGQVAYAVDNVSFTLHEGETLGIVGESGSGKTMTARSLMRLPPEPAAKIVAGEILLDGEDILKLNHDQMREVRGRKIAIILQDPQTSLNPVLPLAASCRRSSDRVEAKS